MDHVHHEVADGSGGLPSSWSGVHWQSGPLVEWSGVHWQSGPLKEWCPLAQWSIDRVVSIGTVVFPLPRRTELERFQLKPEQR